MGNKKSKPQIESFKKKTIKIEETYKFFWKSDRSRLFPSNDSLWRPYDEGDCKFLETQLKLYQNNKETKTMLGNPPRF